MPPRSSLFIIFRSYVARHTGKRPESTFSTSHQTKTGTIIPQWICTHWHTSVVPGDFGLGLTTLRHWKHWPTVTDLCRCYCLWSAFSKRKTWGKCFWSLHRNSEMFPQVPVVLSVLCCCSLSVALDWETKVWTQRKDPESFIANYLTRSELEDLWSTSTGVSSLYAQERPLWSAASLTDIPFYLTIVDHQFHKHLWNSKSFLTKHLTAPSNAKYESFLSKRSHLSLFSSSAKTASNLLLFLPFKENL